jgi:hypothetical protein
MSLTHFVSTRYWKLGFLKAEMYIEKGVLNIFYTLLDLGFYE